MFVDKHIYDACKGNLDALLILGAGNSAPMKESTITDFCKDGHLNVLKEIYANKTLSDGIYITHLVIACQNGHMDICTWLLDNRYDQILSRNTHQCIIMYTQ